jgi:molybdenum cofactor biosynthesis protein A
MQIFDNHGRPINYLRLAVTDRCNLRCFYCMPEEGINYVPKKELMSYEEMLRMVRLFSEMGITKLRITGGEPFVRRDMLSFLTAVSRIENLKIHLTTNGTFTADMVPKLKEIGIASVNLSLDSLDRARFFEITRRDELPKVMKTLDSLLSHNIPSKINTVLMKGKNEEDMLPLVELARHNSLGIRFIEEMPFNGSGAHYAELFWNYQRIESFLRAAYPSLQRIETHPTDTAMNYKIDNFSGTVGIIAAYSRTFCGTCDRLRLTAQGLLKTCLYDNGIFNLRDLMRANASDAQITEALLAAIGNRAANGWEAESLRPKDSIHESMTTIGG